MSWWTESEATPEELAEIARREEEEQRLRADLKRREKLAAEAGYHYPKGTDPPIPRQCPTCGALVPLSGVERHVAWHGDRP